MEKKPSELTFPLSSARKLLKSSLSTPPSAMNAFSAASSSWAICMTPKAHAGDMKTAAHGSHNPDKVIQSKQLS